jgi:16S rRNA (guanine(527)-N(7))-methyltransferase RsmG
MARKSRQPHPTADLPAIDDMQALLLHCGIQLNRPQLNCLWMYHGLLREHNPVLNLTRIRNFKNMVLKLYVDSLLPADLLDLPSPLLDLGTGPGMPGIPLKIYRPQLEIILAESREKRVDFLRRVVDHIQLTGIRVVAGRVTPRFEEPVAGVITRAVETIEQTLERISGCLDTDGRIIFMKGPHCDAEIAAADSRFRYTYELVLDRPYNIPHTLHQRRLLVYRRMDEPLFRRRARATTVHAVRTISSGQNPLFRHCRKLLTGRGIRKLGQALVAGVQPVSETLARAPERCEAWLSSDEPPPAVGPPQLRWFRLAPALFRELDSFGTHSPLLLITLPEIRPWQSAEGFPPGCSVLIPFQNPENVGAAVRSAAAFGASQVILLAESAHPFHPKALRASGGAVLRVCLRQGPTLDKLSADLPIIALSPDGADIRRTAFPPSFGLLAGMEGPGLPINWRSRAVRIPIGPAVESLNAAAAVAVALYEWKRNTPQQANDAREGGCHDPANQSSPLS